MCYAVMSCVRSRNSAPAPFGLFTSQTVLPVAAAVSVLHCTANSTLNMSLLRLSHAKGKKKRGREEVGKLLRRQIPPLFDALMLIHSERTSCLSAYTASLLCFSRRFRGSFFSLSSCLTASFISPFCLHLCLLSNFAFCFVSFSFLEPAHQFLPSPLA